MNYLKKTTLLIFAVLIISSLSSCFGLKLTDEMQQGIDAYLEAVSKSECRTEGKIKVTSVSDDTAIEFNSTESIIECEYKVKNNTVIYTRTDFLNGEKAAEYKCDGQKVMYREKDSDEWIDKTEENAAFISPETNPLTTLALFRVDSNKKVRTDYMTDIKYNSSPDENGYTSVEFTLKDSTVSDILKYNKVKGIVRSSAGHTRTYYIDSEGYISKIEVSTVQKILNNGKEGYYSTEMTVLCE